MKNNRHVVLFSDRQIDMLNELVEKIGDSPTNIIRMALYSFYSKENPSYVKVKEKKIALKEKQLDLAEQGITTTKITNRATANMICERMPNASIIDGVCVYNAYDCVPGKSRIVELKTPLEVLDETWEAAQFLPDKETYLAYCEKKKFDPYNL